MRLLVFPILIIITTGIAFADPYKDALKKATAESLECAFASFFASESCTGTAAMHEETTQSWFSWMSSWMSSWRIVTFVTNIKDTGFDLGDAYLGCAQSYTNGVKKSHGAMESASQWVHIGIAITFVLVTLIPILVALIVLCSLLLIGHKLRGQFQNTSNRSTKKDNTSFQGMIDLTHAGNEERVNACVAHILVVWFFSNLASREHSEENFELFVNENNGWNALNVRAHELLTRALLTRGFKINLQPEQLFMAPGPEIALQIFNEVASILKSEKSEQQATEDELLAGDEPLAITQ